MCINSVLKEKIVNEFLQFFYEVCILNYFEEIKLCVKIFGIIIKLETCDDIIIIKQIKGFSLNNILDIQKMIIFTSVNSHQPIASK